MKYKKITGFLIGMLAFGLLAATVFSQSFAPPHDGSNGVSCLDCHQLDPNNMGLLPIPRGAEQEQLCKTCHDPNGMAWTTSEVANHVVNGGATIIDCSSCHDPHGPHLVTDSHTATKAYNLKLIRADVNKYFPGAMEPAIFQSRPLHFAFGPSFAPWSGICQSCHTQTSYHTRDNSGDNSHYIGEDCISCHSHKSGFDPNGSGSP